MNVEQYKMAAIGKLAEMVKRKNYEPEKLDFDNYDDFVDTREAILNSIINISKRGNILPIEIFSILFESYFIDKIKERFPAWIVKVPCHTINLAYTFQTIEFDDFGTRIFRKLNIDEINTSFFDEFAEFINFNETTFSLELLATSEGKFIAKIKMK